MNLYPPESPRRSLSVPTNAPAKPDLNFQAQPDRDLQFRGSDLGVSASSTFALAALLFLVPLLRDHGGSILHLPSTVSQHLGVAPGTGRMQLRSAAAASTNQINNFYLHHYVPLQ